MRNASRQGRECRTKHTPGRAVPVSVNRSVGSDWVELHEFIRGSSQQKPEVLVTELYLEGVLCHLGKKRPFFAKMKGKQVFTSTAAGMYELRLLRTTAAGSYLAGSPRCVRC